MLLQVGAVVDVMLSHM